MTRLALALLLVTSFCFAQDEASVARTAAGCGPRSVQFNVDTNKEQHPIAQPEAGKALVYVFADPKRAPMVSYISSASIRVGIDGAWVGANRAKSYFFFSVDPGEHRLCSDMNSPVAKVSDVGSAMTLSFEAGKSYYVRATYEERFDRPPFFELERVETAEGMRLVSASAYAKSSPKK